MERYEKYEDSGVEWIGEIPEGWGVKKLKYIANASPSNIDKKSNENEKSVLLCNYVDVYNNEYISSNIAFMPATANEEQIKKFILKKGDVIATKDSETIDDIANPALVIEDFENVVCGYHLTHIKPRTITGRYLFRFFQTNYLNSYFEVSANGITRYGLGVDKFNSALILNPPLKEQTVIANYLDRKTAEIDNLIAQKERLIELYEEEKTAIINQAVTRGIDPNAKLKDSGVDWLGEIPEGWEVKRLKYVGKFINGFSFSSDDFVQNGIRVLKISNIQHMRVDWSDESFINEIFYESHSSFRVFKNDLVFALTRPIISTGIKAAIIDTEDKILLNQRNSIFRTEKIETEWIYYILLSKQFINEFDMRIDKTGQQPNISSNDIGDIAIPVPPQKDQPVIVSTLKTEMNRIQAKIEKTRKIIELQKEYCTTLISEVVTGKIKVTEEPTP